MARVEDQDQALLRAAVAGELRAQVARAGLTQEEVAGRTGLHRVTINRLLTGQRSINTEQLLVFAVALEFDAGDLLDAAQREYRKQRARPDAKDE